VTIPYACAVDDYPDKKIEVDHKKLKNVENAVEPKYLIDDGELCVAI